jgi:hypothetical protein
MVSRRRNKDNDVIGITGSTGDVASGSGANRDSKVVIKRNPCGEKLKIGTWNVRTLLRKGKLENVNREMAKNKLNVLGLSEVRWKEEGDFMSDEVRVIYSGGKESQRGVAIILDKETAKRVSVTRQIDDRLMMVKILAKPVDLVIIQVYMPTTDHTDDEVDEMYEKIEELIEEQKGTDHVIVMGDWNAAVGEGRDGREIGKFGLGKRNERGEKVMEFCKRKELMIANTWFEKRKTQRYT